MDDLARHRATLGLARDARPTHGEVKAAFKRAARAAHPDAAGCAVKFREVVAARDALLGRGRSRDAGVRGGAGDAEACIVASLTVCKLGSSTSGRHRGVDDDVGALETFARAKLAKVFRGVLGDFVQRLVRQKRGVRRHEYLRHRA